MQKEENADEAYVNCICKVKMGKLLINIENTYAGEVQRNGHFLFNKSQRARELELLLFPKQQRNMVDMPTFLPETVYSGRMCLFHWKIWIYGFLTKLTDRLRNFAGSFFHIKSLRNQLCRLLYYEKR